MVHQNPNGHKLAHQHHVREFIIVYVSNGHVHHQTRCKLLGNRKLALAVVFE